MSCERCDGQGKLVRYGAGVTESEAAICWPGRAAEHDPECLPGSAFLVLCPDCQAVENSYTIEVYGDVLHGPDPSPGCPGSTWCMDPNCTRPGCY